MSGYRPSYRAEAVLSRNPKLTYIAPLALKVGTTAGPSLKTTAYLCSRRGFNLPGNVTLRASSEPNQWLPRGKLEVERLASMPTDLCFRQQGRTRVAAWRSTSARLYSQSRKPWLANNDGGDEASAMLTSFDLDGCARKISARCWNGNCVRGLLKSHPETYRVRVGAR